MANRNDWLPATREAKVKMANTWVVNFDEHGEAWRLPNEEAAKFGTAVKGITAMLECPPAQRAPAFTAMLQKAEKDLTAMMRDIRKRYLYIPPLAEADYATMGLRPKDVIPTPVNKPGVRPTVEFRRKREATLELHIKPAEDISHDKRAYYGCKITYGIYDIDAAPPFMPNDMPETKFTKKKREEFAFELKDAGKRACFYLRYENSKGDAGPWCKLLSTVIPH